MPILTDEQAQSNPILKLAAELRRRTYGMCDMGVGPWGYGVNTLPLTKVGAIVCMAPDPYGEKPVPLETKEYTVTIRPIYAEYDSIWNGKHISMDALQRFCQGEDVMTRLAANALREMAMHPVKASVQEDHDAYDAIRIAEAQECERITQEEARQLEELRWYETKTPEEIVDFQVCQSRLCMPMERFREAAEAVFGHPIPETFDDCRKGLLEELIEMKAANTSPCQIGPTM